MGLKDIFYVIDGFISKSRHREITSAEKRQMQEDYFLLCRECALTYRNSAQAHYQPVRILDNYMKVTITKDQNN